MNELNCGKCNVGMAKKGLIQSNNTKYEIWACKQCGNEEMKAITVL